MPKLNEISLKRLANVDKDIATIMIKAAEKSPYEFQITHDFRTIAEQQNLYAKGRTEAGIKVTNCDGITLKSEHNYWPSRAVDIAVFLDDEKRLTWDEKYYKEVGRHILSVADSLYLDKTVKIQLDWGGSWKKFKDYPHFQILK